MKRIKSVLIMACALFLIAGLAEATLVLSNVPTEVSGKYLPYDFSGSGTGNTITVPYTAALLKVSRIPYAVEWIEGDTAPSYPLTVVMTSGSWTLTWTLTDTDRYQYYFEAAGDSASPPTISGDVTVTITADGESSGGLGSGDGTLRTIFW